MSTRWIVHAPNVHAGGGRSLLLALLKALPPSFQGKILLDSRFDVGFPVPSGLCVERVVPSFGGRLLAEWHLRQASATADRVLCFGNLPPLFRLAAPVLVFAQNRYLLDQSGLHGFPLWVKVRISAERRWVRKFYSHADAFVVQTPSMKDALVGLLKGRTPVHVLPFAPGDPHGFERSGRRTTPTETDNWEFLYVASGEPHKNHRNLIAAWRLLATEGIFPTLHLTLPQRDWPLLCSWIDSMKQAHSLRVENLGHIPPGGLKELYREGVALVYPSLLESFGLPLIEARQAGLPILASELDYVRDLVDPEETFDPTSPTSIARAVKRFIGVAELGSAIVDARQFLSILEGLEV